MLAPELSLHFAYYSDAATSGPLAVPRRVINLAVFSDGSSEQVYLGSLSLLFVKKFSLSPGGVSFFMCQFASVAFNCAPVKVFLLLTPLAAVRLRKLVVAGARPVPLQHSLRLQQAPAATACRPLP